MEIKLIFSLHWEIHVKGIYSCVKLEETLCISQESELTGCILFPDENKKVHFNPFKSTKRAHTVTSAKIAMQIHSIIALKIVL